MVDIDHFKQVNDTFGHAAGDGILVGVAERLRLVARPQDAVCRFGGEEFVVLLPGCAPDDAPTVGDRIRRRVASERFCVPPDAEVALTCSVGVASWTPGESPQLLVMRADVALYDAKRAGRDRVAVASASLRSPSPTMRDGVPRSYHPHP
jgi:diguanylate cyclase (GGDEF)-like protein